MIMMACSSLWPFERVMPKTFIACLWLFTLRYPTIVNEQTFLTMFLDSAIPLSYARSYTVHSFSIETLHVDMQVPWNLITVLAKLSHNLV